MKMTRVAAKKFLVVFSIVLVISLSIPHVSLWGFNFGVEDVSAVSDTDCTSKGVGEYSCTDIPGDITNNPGYFQKGLCSGARIRMCFKKDSAITGCTTCITSGKKWCKSNINPSIGFCTASPDCNDFENKDLGYTLTTTCDSSSPAVETECKIRKNGNCEEIVIQTRTKGYFLDNYGSGKRYCSNPNEYCFAPDGSITDCSSCLSSSTTRSWCDYSNGMAGYCKDIAGGGDIFPCKWGVERTDKAQCPGAKKEEPKQQQTEYKLPDETTCDWCIRTNRKYCKPIATGSLGGDRVVGDCAQMNQGCSAYYEEIKDSPSCPKPTCDSLCLNQMFSSAYYYMTRSSSSQQISLPIGQCSQGVPMYVYGSMYGQQSASAFSLMPMRPSGVGPDVGCPQGQECWCLQINAAQFQQNTASTNYPSPTIPGRTQTKNWKNSREIKNPPASAVDQYNGVPSSGTITAKIDTQLLQAGDEVTITGAVAKQCSTCDGWIYNCEAFKELTCKIEEGTKLFGKPWKIKYKYENCPADLPEFFDGEGEKTVTNRKQIVDDAITVFTLYKIAGSLFDGDKEDEKCAMMLSYVSSSFGGSSGSSTMMQFASAMQMYNIFTARVVEVPITGMVTEEIEDETLETCDIADYERAQEIAELGSEESGAFTLEPTGMATTGPTESDSGESGISSSCPALSSTEITVFEHLNTDDCVKTKVSLNVREGAGTDKKILNTLPPEAIGIVKSGPLAANNYNWYYIKWPGQTDSSGLTLLGWSAQGCKSNGNRYLIYSDCETIPPETQTGAAEAGSPACDSACKNAEDTFGKGEKYTSGTCQPKGDEYCNRPYVILANVPAETCRPSENCCCLSGADSTSRLSNDIQQDEAGTLVTGTPDTCQGNGGTCVIDSTKCVGAINNKLKGCETGGVCCLGKAKDGEKKSTSSCADTLKKLMIAKFAANMLLKEPSLDHVCYSVCGTKHDTDAGRAPVCFKGLDYADASVPVSYRNETYQCREGYCGMWANRKVRIEVFGPAGNLVRADYTTTDSSGMFSYTFSAPHDDGEFTAIVSIPRE